MSTKISMYQSRSAHSAYRATEEGAYLMEQIDKVVSPLLTDIIRRGGSPREVGFIADAAISEVCRHEMQLMQRSALAAYTGHQEAQSDPEE